MTEAGEMEAIKIFEKKENLNWDYDEEAVIHPELTSWIFVKYRQRGY